MAALLRLLLSQRDGGMLAMRSRFVDAVLLGGTGTAMIVLASAIATPPV